MKTCKNCEYYTDETHTPTGIGIAYCYEKQSRRYRMPTGSIQTVVYADDHCRYWKEKKMPININEEAVELYDEPKISKRAEILHKAEHCICGQREQDYGSPETNFAIIAEMWSAYTGAKITPLDVAMMMCLLKIARIKNGGGTGDSFVDLCGYGACGGEIFENDRK